MNNALAVTTYILAIMSGLCFVGGVMVLSGGREKDIYGKN